jgi:uncharacterized protein
VFADDFPEKQNPPRLVNDFGQFLSPSEIDALENKLLSYEDSTSTQIAIVTVADLKDYDKGDYANRLFEKWQIGQKGKDNGILILLSKQERAIWIETGYGMEGKFPDAVVQGLVNETMIPYFKQGQFYQGLDVALDEIMQRASGEFKSDGKKKGGGSVWVTLLILFVMFIIFNKLRGPGNETYSSRGHRGGGFMGGGFGGGGFGGGGGGGGGFGGFGGGGSGGGGAGGNW